MNYMLFSLDRLLFIKIFYYRELTETDKDALVSQLFEYYKRLVALQVYAQIT